MLKTLLEFISTHTENALKEPRCGSREAAGDSHSLAVDREKLQAIPTAPLWIARSSRRFTQPCCGSREALGDSTDSLWIARSSRRFPQPRCESREAPGDPHRLAVHREKLWAAPQPDGGSREAPGDPHRLVVDREKLQATPAGGAKLRSVAILAQGRPVGRSAVFRKKST